MVDVRDDAMAACDSLAEPMGQLIGAGVGVPVGAGVMIGADAAAGPAAPVALPFAIGAGASAGWGAYDQTRDFVSDNWHDAVCEPLAAWAQGPSEPSSTVDAFCPTPADTSANTFDFSNLTGGSFCATPDYGSSSVTSDYSSSSSASGSSSDYGSGSSGGGSSDSSPSSD